MPAAPIVGAVIAIAAAAEIVTPVAIGLAVIATAGAVASTVGTITGDKTLSMVGNIMGAVGSIGGIANGLGFFGEAAAGALGAGSGVTNAAGGGAIQVSELAAPTAQAAATGPAAFAPEALQSLDSAMTGVDLASDGATALNSTGAAGQGSIVDTITAQVASVTPSTAEAPTAALAEVKAPAAAIDQTANAAELAPNPAADLAVDPSRGLLNQPLADQPPPVQPSEFGDPAAQARPMVEAPSVTPADYMNANVDTQGTGLMQMSDAAQTYPTPMDAYGNPVGQGDIPDGWGSPAGAGGPDAAGQSLPDAIQPQQQVTTANQSPKDYGPSWDTGAQIGTPDPMQPSKVVVNGQTGMEPPAAQTPPAGDTGYTNMAMKPGVSRQGDYGPGWTSGTSGSKSDGSLWSDFLSFAKENKTLVLGGMMSLGSFMSGALSPKTPAEVDALNAQAERNRAAAQLEYTQNQLMQRRLNNMGQALPVARRGGLINMGVTGRPA